MIHVPEVDPLPLVEPDMDGADFGRIAVSHHDVLLDGLAEDPHEIRELCGRDGLIADHQHFAFDQGGAQRVRLGGARTREIDPEHLRADGRVNRARLRIQRQYRCERWWP